MSRQNQWLFEIPLTSASSANASLEYETPLEQEWDTSAGEEETFPVKRRVGRTGGIPRKNSKQATPSQQRRGQSGQQRPDHSRQRQRSSKPSAQPQTRQLLVIPTSGEFQSALFQGDPDLLAVLRGQLRLGRSGDPQYPAPIKSQGSAVAKVQTALVELGYLQLIQDTNDRYGNETYNAVLKYKRLYNIRTETGYLDGIVGPKTIWHLDTALAQKQGRKPKFIRVALNGAPGYEQYAYFFGTSNYRTYKWKANDFSDGDRLDDKGSLPIFVWHLPPNFHSNLDAALNGYGDDAHYAYFLKGSQYVRYNWNNKRVDEASASIGERWKLDSIPASKGSFTANLDAALQGKGSQFGHYTYFFKGDKYARYDCINKRVDLVASLSEWNLKGDFLQGIDAAVNGWGRYAGIAYFFKGDQYFRYYWGLGKAEGPIAMAQQWTDLLKITEAPQRRVVLYVTIDEVDRKDTFDKKTEKKRHDDNIECCEGTGGLRPIALDFRSNIHVEDFWCPKVVESMLQDPHVLALFSAGSWPEWVEAFRNRDWRSKLDTYCKLIQKTNVPILAVCGSHQLVAYAYGGWSTIRHMAEKGLRRVPISAESDGIFRAPNPRTGEVGVYQFYTDRPADPIFNGLPNQKMYFVEYHHDEVFLQALPPGIAKSILKPDGIKNALRKSPYDMDVTTVKPGDPPLRIRFEHRRISVPEERTIVQALKYQVTPAGRILYTTQFHPELIWAEEPQGEQAKDAAEHGKIFIQNFLKLADQYWQQFRLRFSDKPSR